MKQANWSAKVEANYKADRQLSPQEVSRLLDGAVREIEILSDGSIRERSVGSAVDDTVTRSLKTGRTYY